MKHKQPRQHTFLPQSEPVWYDSQFHDEDELVRRLEDLVQPHHAATAARLIHGGHLVQDLAPRVDAQSRLAAELGGEMVARAELQTLVHAGPLAAAGEHKHGGGE